MPPTSEPRGLHLTVDLLAAYRDAAFANAESLAAEAALLLAAGHHARSYFLAVSSIEETGKAVQAADGMRRNLTDPAVRTRLQIQFENHSNKITSAFVPWMAGSTDLRSEAAAFAEIAMHVKNGREPSMYTDFSADGLRVVSPASVVRAVAAESCIRLCRDLLGRAREYIHSGQISPSTRAEDRFFALNQKTFLKMANTADFWEYYIDRIKGGNNALAPAAVSYHDKYLSKGLPYRRETNGGAK